ncbi:MAG: hypothetical protein FH751_02520 [Firmicutes bacterium]|nr:hypothetical protein [Bacillota bacterium]
MVEVPFKVTVRTLIEGMLHQLGDQFAHSMNSPTDVKKQRLIKLIKDKGIKLIIFDESQHFIASNSKGVLDSLIYSL